MIDNKLFINSKIEYEPFMLDIKTDRYSGYEFTYNIYHLDKDGKYVKSDVTFNPNDDRNIPKQLIIYLPGIIYVYDAYSLPEYSNLPTISSTPDSPSTLNNKYYIIAAAGSSRSYMWHLYTFIPIV